MVIKNIRPTYPGISEQEAWEGFGAVASREGLCDSSSAACGVCDFEGDVINSSGVYGFPAEASECMRWGVMLI